MNRLICIECHQTYTLNEPIWRCQCGGLMDIEFEPIFNWAKVRKLKADLWRYREAIPIESEHNIISFDEGFTPLLPFDFGGTRVLVKQDQLFMTGSYKDRGAAVLISKARELGIIRVVEDSSGNAGCAIAAYCARAGIDCHIYVPDSTSLAKLAQIELYGATLNLVPGSREDTARAVMKAAETTYYASHSWNPFFFQGTKTIAYEVFEQLGQAAPDSLVLPAGNGTLILGAWLGFQDLVKAGLAERMPKIIAIQAEGCAPLFKAFQENLDHTPHIEKKDTLAEGIAIAEPVRGRQIVDAVRSSSGMFLTVTEQEIQNSLKDICCQGAYIEPTSAATTAGVGKYLNTLHKDEVVVSIFTGHGLKSTEKMLKILEGH